MKKGDLVRDNAVNKYFIVARLKEIGKGNKFYVLLDTKTGWTHIAYAHNLKLVCAS